MTKLALELAPSPKTVNLDLGCGQRPREGYEGVDLYSEVAEHRVNLFQFPWPWADESVDALHVSHFAEHIPAREVEQRDLSDGMAGQFLGQDMFFAFFDECWRILKDRGTMEVVVPALESMRAFQDPTHRRFITQATFCYLSQPWRKANGLDHYRIRCNFDGPVHFTVSEEMSLLHPEAAEKRIRESWNVKGDYIAKLFKVGA